MIACDTCTQRSAIVVFDAWPAGRANAHATDSLWGAHAYGENSLPTPNLAPKTGSISGPTICSLPYWAGFGGRWLVCDCETGPRNSAFFSPFALSFGAQYLVSMAAAATILCLPDRLDHQNVYLLKVSSRNPNHMRSKQLLRLQAYTHMYLYIYV